MSETEPELGLGTVIKVEGRYAEIAFETRNTFRRYGLGQASLRRVIFKPGDTVRNKKGAVFIITSVHEEGPGAPAMYQCGAVAVGEAELADTVNVSTPLQKLMTGIVSSAGTFDLRSDALNFKTTILGSSLRGFVGGRIELLPHQLNIAQTVSSRKNVRALLADETGLGKTIESCLILHRLLTTGRASRALIIVPDHLVNQWFVELYRRFNRSFFIYSIDDFGNRDDENPFLAHAAGICGADLLSHSDEARAKATAAPWDLVIVDEAHHLTKDGGAFNAVKALSMGPAEGLLLLTATPEQLGRESHFARLQLLDPHRYRDFAEYEIEMNALRRIGTIVKNALNAAYGGSAAAHLDTVKIDVPDDIIGRAAADGPRTHAMTIDQIIDIFGTGRAMFRNTRRVIAGFPERLVHIVPLEASAQVRARATQEVLEALRGDVPAAVGLSGDPRISWLTELLKTGDHEKMLVICSSQDMALAISEACLKIVKTDIALFHESMTIIQRDRNAAWFAEENGARLLVCSEIGSEGRNFQFCQCLIPFDLPLFPELVEQRIGRLDRIGQKPRIHIYVPYVRGTPQETLCRWYHEGLDAFNRNVPAAGTVFEALRPRLLGALTGSAPPEMIDGLLADARTMRDDVMKKSVAARDELFDVISFQPGKSYKLAQAIKSVDAHPALKNMMGRLFKYYGIAIEDAGREKYALLTEYVTDNGFPLPRNERPVITYDRATALAREDVEFVTIDHPMVMGALDLMLSSDRGASSFAVWKDPTAREILLETVFVVECVAPAKLCADRFLPSSAVRCVVGHKGHGRNATPEFPVELLRKQCVNGEGKLLKALCKSYSAVIARMFEASAIHTRENADPQINSAIETMRAVYDAEIGRLDLLQRLKGLSIKNEIEELTRDKKDLEKYLAASVIRLDSVRLIYHGPDNVF
jgi:ATP-dependent helicase HepA